MLTHVTHVCFNESRMPTKNALALKFEKYTCICICTHKIATLFFLNLSKGQIRITLVKILPVVKLCDKKYPEKTTRSDQ